MGHVGIQPENVGIVAADDRTRAKHRFKFRAVGSFNTSIPPLFCGSNRRRLELASVPCGGSVNHSIFQGGAVQVDVGRIRTVKRHLPPFRRYSTRRTVNYFSEQRIGVSMHTAGRMHRISLRIMHTAGRMHSIVIVSTVVV